MPSKPHCVVKQFHLSEQADEFLNKAAELFRQEAIHLEQLGRHPQITQLFAHFEQEQRLYLVQEFIEGLTLAQELKLIIFNEGQILQLLHDLLQVLKFIHDRQVIHRDIKPENIIRRRQDGKFVLIDFGVAKLLTDTARLRTGTAIGSQDYVAPEQIRGKAVPASDLYSLGVTCIHLLTRVPPLDMYDLENDRWGWRLSLPKGAIVSDLLGEILDKLLESSIRGRYKSADEVLQELNAANAVLQELNAAPDGVTQPLPPISSTSSAAETAQLSVGPPAAIPLTSKVGVDYTKLQALLEGKKWKEADRETWNVMCQAIALPIGTQLEVSDINRFPCEDLRTLDNLWVKYSEGRFGFSVQKQIYESVGGDYIRYCDRVYWPTFNSSTTFGKMKFSLHAPVGHLPSRMWVGGTQWLRHAGAIAARLAKCNTISLSC